MHQRPGTLVLHAKMQVACAILGCAQSHPAHAADIISAIEFDASGQHLATGDRGGRVVLFERVAIQNVSL